MGGVERYASQLAERLEKAGCRVTVVAMRSAGGEFSERQGNLRVFRLPCYPLMGGRLPLPKRTWKSAQVMKNLRRENFALVLVNTRFYPLSLTGVRFAHGNGLPLIVVEHGTGYLELRNPLLNACERLCEHALTGLEKRYCKHFYGVSEACLEWLKTFNICGEGTLCNAVDLDFIDENLARPVVSFRSELRIPKDAPVVAFVGRLVPEKGIWVLKSSVEKLRGEFPDLRLIAAGEGPDEKKLKEQASDCIHFLGKISPEKVIALLAECDVFCLPSRSEGLPTSVLEAAACRRYVITTARGGSKELITDDSYGKILPDNGEEGVTRALREALENPEMCRRAANRTYERLKEDFTWDKTAQKLLHIAEKMAR